MDDVILLEIEQLGELSGGARRFGADTEDAFRRLQSVAIRFGTQIDAEIRSRKSAYDACDPERRDCSPLLESWQRAVRAREVFASDSRDALSRLERERVTITALSDGAAGYFDRLRYHLAGTPEADAAFRAAAAGGSAASAASGFGSGGGGAGPRALPNQLERVSLSDVDVPSDLFETRAAKGGASKEDMVWAGSMWKTEIAPGFERGLTREDFEARDAESGATGLRRLAGVWDLYLGSDGAHGDMRSDGRIDLGGGTHRVLAAKLAGADWVPIRVHGRSG